MAVLDRVPVERITAEAREIQLGRTLLTLLAGLFYMVGWVAAKIVNIIWFASAWSWTAVKVGWKEGRAKSSLTNPGG